MASQTRPDPEAGHKRDMGVVGQTHQVGALFEALNECFLMAHSYKNLGSLLVITNCVRHPEHDLHGP